ncbi:MAG: TIGR04282 family arsenosugar biosynthesis glycosyltransferase [Clostridia bacterium]
MRRGTAILVFARAPSPGRAKTRLAAAIGPWRAARLQAGLTLHALRVALAAAVGPVEIHAAPPGHAFFAAARRKFPVELAGQRGRDLGERMERALARALRRHRAAILIGTDCPDLGAADLRRAARWLRGATDAAVAPAEDGGYALVAMRKPRAAVFAQIPWGHSRVYAETAARLDASGLRWRALRTVWDVDRPEDLARLAKRRPAFLQRLTRAQVRRPRSAAARRR